MAQSGIDLSGAVVLITGGTRGIGRAMVEAFAKSGATVATCGRTPPAEALPASFHACDVRKPDAVAALADLLASQHGRIDVLINNAGGSPPADAATASPRFSEAIVALNLLGPLHMAQACQRHMPPGSSIINIASISALRPSPGTAAYGAAKAGLLGLSRSLAQEWAPRIRVNAIIAGLIETEAAETTYGSAEVQAEIAATVPMGRLGLGSDIAQAALFLASPLASFITGAELAVHGGGERPPFLDILKAHSHG